MEYTGYFDEMVKMMEESDDISMKLLIEKTTQEVSIAFSKDSSTEKVTSLIANASSNSDKGTCTECSSIIGLVMDIFCTLY